MSFLRAVYFSLALHFILYLLIYIFPSEWTPPETETAEIEIINRPFDDKKDKQIVRQAKVPKKLKILEETKARFMSADDQRVLMETRAQNIGLTQNRDMRQPQRPERPDFDKPKTEERDLSGYQPIRLPRPNETLEDGPSTVGETLPQDIAIGSFTALNTDRFQFYTFYARVEELVRFRWETQVRGAIDEYDRRHVLNQVGRKNWITHVEFLITPDGILKASRVMKESGMKIFDQAAVLAFRDARVFPNPPKELIEDDGYIHLRYAFNVYFEPSAFASQ